MQKVDFYLFDKGREIVEKVDNTMHSYLLRSHAITFTLSQLMSIYYKMHTGRWRLSQHHINHIPLSLSSKLLQATRWLRVSLQTTMYTLLSTVTWSRRRSVNSGYVPPEKKITCGILHSTWFRTVLYL